MRGRDDISQRVVLSEVTDLHIREMALAEISLRDGRAVDVHCTRVSVTEGIDFSRGRLSGSTHFDEVESVGPVEFNDSEAAGDFHFSQCVFRDEFRFDDARLVGDLHLANSIFHGRASFERGTYRGDLHISNVEAKSQFFFRRVTVSGHVVLADAMFHSDLLQEEGLYHGDVVMRKVSVAGQAMFDRVTSHGDRLFRDLKFEGAVRFSQGRYAGSMLFEDVTFADAVTFEEAVFHSEVVFRNVEFAGPVNFRGARFHDELRFEHVTFGAAVEFHVRVDGLILKSVSFANQASMVLDYAEARIEDTKFAAPLTLDSTTTCRVLSLTGTDATNLVLARVDLSTCSLSDTYNLDRMKVESAAFPLCPTGWSFRRHWPFAVKRTARRVIPEEAVVRLSTDRPQFTDDWRPLAPENWARTQPASASDVARVYRQLRKAREEAKDEPGAADFYYGEMEMRRRAAPRWSVEGFVLWLYWLTAGYGLRASRAITCLVALVVVCATLMGKIGFADPHTWSASLVYVADTATKLVGFSTSEKLTGWGVALQILVRLAGPVLLGLAVLSIRGRTKR